MDINRAAAGLVGPFYAAALDPTLWGDALRPLQHMLGGIAHALFHREFASHAPFATYVSVSGYADWVPQAYASHFATCDLRIPAAAGVMPGGAYVDDRDMPYEIIRDSEIGQDFYRPLGLGHCVGAALLRSPARVSVFSVHRAADARGFSPRQVALFEAVAPHLEQALRVQRQTERAAAVTQAHAALLDRFPTAALLLDAAGRVLALNAAAEALLRVRRGPLRSEGGRLAAVPPATDRLRAAIAAAADPHGRPPPILRLRHGDGSLVSVLVAPSGGSPQLILVLAAEPAKTWPTDAGRLAQEFCLSPAEADVAARIAQGQDIAAIAEHRGVSVETVRTQLKTVLAKLGIGSQAALVGTVHRSLAACATGGVSARFTAATPP